MSNLLHIQEWRARLDTDERWRWAALAFVVAVVNLHSLRNVVPVPYALVYAATFVALVVIVLRRFSILDPAFRNILLWIGMVLLGVLTTTVISGWRVAAYGAFRFAFAIPVFLALIAFTRTRRDVYANIIVIVSLFAIGSLTLPLQLVTGEISWFGDASERAGFVRYTSVFGTLTSYGYSVGPYLVLALLSPVVLRAAQWIAILLATAMSLSKAAFASAVLAAVFIFWPWRRQPKVLASIAALAVSAGVVVLSVPGIRGRLFAVLQTFGLHLGNEPATDDYSFTHSVMSRLTHYPAQNIEALRHLNPVVWLTGGGFGFGNSALVLDKDSLAPMAHNQYVELFTVFGPVGTAAALWCAVSLVMTFWRGRTDDPRLAHVALGTMTLIGINSLFANGTLYQPAAATPLYLCFFLGSRWSTLCASQGSDHQRRQPESAV